MSRIVFAGVVAWVDPNLKKLNICSIRAGLRFLSTRTYINNVHSCSVVHTSTEFYFLTHKRGKARRVGVYMSSILF